jgi:hypothetical protein
VPQALEIVGHHTFLVTDDGLGNPWHPHRPMQSLRFDYFAYVGKTRPPIRKRRHTSHSHFITPSFNDCTVRATMQSKIQKISKSKLRKLLKKHLLLHDHHYHYIFMIGFRQIVDILFEHKLVLTASVVIVILC